MSQVNAKYFVIQKKNQLTFSVNMKLIQQNDSYESLNTIHQKGVSVLHIQYAVSENLNARGSECQVG